MATLFRVETSYVILEIKGPAELPTVLELHRPSRDPHFSMHSTDDEAVRSDGLSSAPILFEEAEYWFIAESKVFGVQPLIAQRDSSLIIRSEEMIGSGIVAATVRYRRQVGLSNWTVRVGDHALSIEVEVFPTKLDYDTDYEALVDEVTDVKRALALEYFRGTYQVGDEDRTKVGEPLEWISILRRQMAALERSIQQVSRSPQRGLRYERQLTSLHQVRGATPSVVMAIARGEGHGESTHLPGVGDVHSQLPVNRTNDTLDTFEHRWLRSRLRFIHTQLLDLKVEQRARIEMALKRSRGASSRLRAELAELTAMTVTLEQLIALPAIEAATVDVPATYSSLQLQAGVGYGEAYQILMALSSAVTAGGGLQPYSLADVNEIYEIWCFLKIALIAKEITGADLDLSQILVTASSGLRYNLVKGAKSAIELTWIGGRVTVVYNPEYKMPTGVQKPDVILRIQIDGMPEKVVVLDAKYRLEATAEYVAQFGSPGAPVDAVNALHRYRDAIRPLVDGVRVPTVVMGAALFPWPSPLAENEYGLRKAIREVGIGALPFLPGNLSNVAEWMRELLETPRTGTA